MRARNIKPGFFKNELLAQLPYAARILFAGLWGLADREGRLEDRPLRIKAEVFPYDNEDVGALLEQLTTGKDPFIIRYVVDEVSYIVIAKFLEHQSPHINEKPSLIPPISRRIKKSTVQAPDDSGTSTVQAPVDAPLARAYLNPSSLNPSSLNEDSGMRNPDCSSPANNQPAQAVDDPDWDDVDVGAGDVAVDAPPDPPIKPPRDDAGALVAWYVDCHKDLKRTPPTARLKGQEAKEIAEQLALGANPATLRKAIRLQVEEGKAPSILALKVGDAERGPRGRADPHRIPDNVAAALALVAECEEEERNAAK